MKRLVLILCPAVLLAAGCSSRHQCQKCFDTGYAMGRHAGRIDEKFESLKRKINGDSSDAQDEANYRDMSELRHSLKIWRDK